MNPTAPPAVVLAGRSAIPGHRDTPPSAPSPPAKDTALTDDQTPQPTAAEWQHAINLLLQVEDVLADSIASGRVEQHDHHIIGLPSSVEGATPGGARIEAALHAIAGARHLIQQAVTGRELPGVPVLERAQKNLALAGGYVAATWSTELTERVDRRGK